MNKDALLPDNGRKNPPQLLESSYVPQTVVPMDKAAIIKKIPDWETDNAAYIVLTTGDRYYVDLELVLRDLSAGMAEWMAEQDEFIVFEELYPLLEIRHKVLPQNQADMTAAASASRLDAITYEDLKQRLISLKIDAHNHYDCVLQVNLNPLTLSKGTYDFNFDGASIPLINAIIYNHGLINPTFRFGTAGLGGHNDAVFFEVEEKGEHVGFYDFSHRPPLRFL